MAVTFVLCKVLRVEDHPLVGKVHFVYEDLLVIELRPRSVLQAKRR